MGFSSPACCQDDLDTFPNLYGLRHLVYKTEEGVPRAAGGLSGALRVGTHNKLRFYFDQMEAQKYAGQSQFFTVLEEFIELRPCLCH